MLGTHFWISFETLSRYDKGGHLFLPSYVMRTHGSRKQQDAIHRLPGKQMQKVFEVKNCKVYFCVCVCVAFPHSSRSLTEIFASFVWLSLL